MGKQTVYLDDAGHVIELSMAAAGGQWAEANLTALSGAPAAGQGSALSGYEWTAGHSKQVVFFDDARHVWELSEVPGGSWSAANLTGLTGAPKAVAGSPLSGFQWLAEEFKQVVYFDDNGHVHQLSTRPNQPWTHVDLTVLSGAPPAIAGSSLCGFGWAVGYSKQVVYLDANGHIHELSLTAAVRGATWVHLDLTARTRAVIAAPASALSGYEWTAGSSKQIVYLANDGHVHELSRPVAAGWATADLTARSGAPPPRAGSPLSGFDWAVGQSKQVVYLDAEAHVHELSATVGAGWAAADLTALTGAPAAAAGSAMSGYQWTAANSKQVVYLDDEHQVRELSRTSGTAWLAANVTALGGAPAAVGGSALSGYKAPTDLLTLYGSLRAQLLSRHFAIGRHFRADHLSYYNAVGVVHQAGKHVVYLDDAHHVHELVLRPDGQWADGGDLTLLTSAPPAGTDSALEACQWAIGTQLVAYIDGDGHVHVLVTAGGQWFDEDVTRYTGAPAARVNWALSAYPWIGGNSAQVAYLDALCHVHEMSSSADVGWTDTDLTLRTLAPPAAPRSHLAGFDWEAGQSKQVVYLDEVGHIWELSLSPGGQWTSNDLTYSASAPPAVATSPLSAYGWVAGKSKQVVYLDDAGHVWELSITLGGQWAATDLTKLTGAQVAEAGPALCGFECVDGNFNRPAFDWPSANTKQVVYLDKTGEVWELSLALRGSDPQWAAVNLTALTEAQRPAGSQVSAYAWATGLSKQVVFRDTSGHIWELSKSNVAGQWTDTPPLDLTGQTGAHVASSSSPLSGYEWPGLTGNLLEHGFLWSTDGTNVMPPTPVYTTTANLRALPAAQSLFERWRVGDHSRANPLMFTGKLMACLAVETALEIPGSKDILSRVLATTRSLFKFSTPPFDGYIVRWDAATSDHWATAFFEGGDIATFTCEDFLTDPDDPDGAFLYCTPLDDPRYVPYMPGMKFVLLSPAEQQNYQNIRRLSLDMTRYWEPSIDELTGLLAGYSFVHAVVTDPDIQQEVADQVARIGRYLAANAYVLVRPQGGFAAQGGSGIAPALEFPFGRVFSRVTGSAHPALTGFEGALQNAKQWSEFSEAFGIATWTGPLTGPALLVLISAFAPTLGEWVAVLISELGGFSAFLQLVGGGGLAKTLLLLANSEAFDVYSWYGHHDQQQEFALAYLLMQIPPVPRFNAAIEALGLGIGSFAENFPPYLGLMAFQDPDQIVGDAFLGWLAARRAAHDTTAINDPFASAVAVLLGSGQAEQKNLVALLRGLVDSFDETMNDQLHIYDDSLGYNGNITYATEEVLPALDLMSALALAWFFSETQSEAGNPVPANIGFPAPPPAGMALPAATIPDDVVRAAQQDQGDGPAQVIPIDALPPLPGPLPAEIDLFAADAPRKPADVTPLATPVRWVFASPKSHYGNPFGDHGTDTVNAGMKVSGSGCTIIGVKLELVDNHGNPLADVNNSTTKFGADASDGSYPFTAGARIVSDGSSPTDETVTVEWWYAPFRACRYQIGYLVQGVNCAL